VSDKTLLRRIRKGERKRIARAAREHADGWAEAAREAHQTTAWDSMERALGAEKALRDFADELETR
jgi:phage regulator Rha-like protein